MAKTCLRVKAARPNKFPVRSYSRCKLCGRPRAFMRKFGMCRLCFRKYVHRGEIPGATKASW